MKAIVAAGNLKGTLSAPRAAGAMARGVHRAAPAARIVTRCVADGGPGTLELAAERLGARLRRATVRDARGDRIEAPWAVMGGRDRHALLEAARACGLPAFPERAGRLDASFPMTACTDGVGDLLRAARASGAHRIFVGVGGSVTTDGGSGALRALGARLVDAKGRPVPPGGGGLLSLARVELVALDAEIRAAGRAGRLTVLADVANPLLGPHGAAAVYAPQKGASPEQVADLERGLERFAERLEAAGGLPARDLPGAGASGGLAYGLAAALGASIEPGARRLLDASGFDVDLDGADLVLTCEGRWDGDHHAGKAPFEVARRAARRGVPCAVLCGEDASPAPEPGGAAGGPGPLVLSRRGATLSEEDLSAMAEEAVRRLVGGGGVE